MYEVKISLTDEVIITDDLRNMLATHRLFTFKDVETLDIFDINVETLDYFLKTSSFVFELVYDPFILSLLKKICDIMQAYTLIESKYWDGKCNMFDINLMNSIDLCTSIVNNHRWNGNCDDFHNVMNNKEFIELIISSDKWDGCTLSFPNNIMEELSFLRRLLKCSKWNGNCEAFFIDYVTDDDFVQEIIESPFWNGESYMFDVKDVSLFREIIKDKRWDGTCSGFSRQIMKDESLLFEIIDTPNWNASTTRFCFSVKTSVSYLAKVDQHPRYNKTLGKFDLVYNPKT